MTTQSSAITKIVTIGAYGFDEASFFAALQSVGVDMFCDIRRRRGVRGAAYSFANSKRLQARLAELDIRYQYCPTLAPSHAVRQAQYAVDKHEKTAKRQRTVLSSIFIDAYTAECLADFDPIAFADGLPTETKVFALFCVEREAAACHRSLVATRLCEALGCELVHLQPQ